MTGAERFNSACYKLFNLRSSDKHWIESMCLDQNSYLIDDLTSDSTDEIIFLASLIEDLQADEFVCVVTGITRSKVSPSNCLFVRLFALLTEFPSYQAQHRQDSHETGQRQPHHLPQHAREPQRAAFHLCSEGVQDHERHLAVQKFRGGRRPERLVLCLQGKFFKER